MKKLAYFLYYDSVATDSRPIPALLEYAIRFHITIGLNLVIATNRENIKRLSFSLGPNSDDICFYEIEHPSDSGNPLICFYDKLIEEKIIKSNCPWVERLCIYRWVVAD